MQELNKFYIKDIAKIELETFKKNAWSESNIEKEIDNPNCTFQILVENEVLIGYYSYYKSFDEAYINNIAVSAKFRSKGYGKILLKELIHKAREEQINNITLEVRKSNIIARKLYESFNFKNEGIRPKFYDNTEDAVIYWYRMEE